MEQRRQGSQDLQDLQAQGRSPASAEPVKAATVSQSRNTAGSLLLETRIYKYFPNVI